MEIYTNYKNLKKKAKSIRSIKLLKYIVEFTYNSMISIGSIQ